MAKKINFTSKFVEKLQNGFDKVGMYGFSYNCEGLGGVSTSMRSDRFRCEGVDGKFLIIYAEEENTWIEIPTDSTIVRENNDKILTFIFPNKSKLSLMFNDSVDSFI